MGLVAVWSAGCSGTALARLGHLRVLRASQGSRRVVRQLRFFEARFLGVHHYRPVDRCVEDGLAEVQPLLLVHDRPDREDGLLLLLLVLVGVHHQGARL